MFSKPTLHTRADGSKYMLDVAEFTLQEGKVNAFIELFNGVAETLTKYKDTKDRAKNPDYLRGVLKGRTDFIEQSRANEIYESLKNFPLGERAKTKLVADSIDEIDGELYKELERYASNVLFYHRDMKKPISIDDDLVITAGEEKCSVSIREGFIDELRTSMTREITEEIAKDIEDFRAAMQTLFRLTDKGYNLKQKGGVGYDGKYQVYPSHVEVMLGKAPEERKELLTTENIIKILK